MITTHLPDFVPISERGVGAHPDYEKRREWWGRFLESFAITGRLGQAAQMASIHPATVHKYLQHSQEFRRLYQEACERAFQRLVDEAHRRAVEGQSDQVLIFLLRTLGRKIFGDKMEVDHTGEVRVTKIEVNMPSSIPSAEELARDALPSAPALPATPGDPAGA